MLATPIDIDADGLLRVPPAPGLGAEIDEDALASLVFPQLPRIAPPGYGEHPLAPLGTGTARIS